MLKTQTLVPEVYYKESRDFQLLGRIYDIVFNYLKNNINELNYTNTNQINENLIELVLSTLGFKKIHDYDINQLRGLCSIFSYIIRNKGNLNSFNELIHMLSRVAGYSYKSEEDVSISVEILEDEHIIQITLPPEVKNISLLLDLLDYILPAGMQLELIRKYTQQIEGIETQTISTDSREILVAKDIEKSVIIKYDDDIVPADKEAGRNDNMTIPQYGEGEE